jgi:hypothetical protein
MESLCWWLVVQAVNFSNVLVGGTSICIIIYHYRIISWYPPSSLSLYCTCKFFVSIRFRLFVRLLHTNINDIHSSYPSLSAIQLQGPHPSPHLPPFAICQSRGAGLTYLYHMVCYVWNGLRNACVVGTVKNCGMLREVSSIRGTLLSPKYLSSYVSTTRCFALM